MVLFLQKYIISFCVCREGRHALRHHQHSLAWADSPSWSVICDLRSAETAAVASIADSPLLLALVTGCWILQGIGYWVYCILYTGYWATGHECGGIHDLHPHRIPMDGPSAKCPIRIRIFLIPGASSASFASTLLISSLETRSGDPDCDWNCGQVISELWIGEVVIGKRGNGDGKLRNWKRGAIAGMWWMWVAWAKRKPLMGEKWFKWS